MGHSGWFFFLIFWQVHYPARCVGAVKVGGHSCQSTFRTQSSPAECCIITRWLLLLASPVGCCNVAAGKHIHTVHKPEWWQSPSQDVQPAEQLVPCQSAHLHTQCNITPPPPPSAANYLRSLRLLFTIAGILAIWFRMNSPTSYFHYASVSVPRSRWKKKLFISGSGFAEWFLFIWFFFCHVDPLSLHLHLWLYFDNRRVWSWANIIIAPQIVCTQSWKNTTPVTPRLSSSNAERLDPVQQLFNLRAWGSASYLWHWKE